MEYIKKNFNKLIAAFVVLLIGILGSLVVKDFPSNTMGLIMLVVLGIFRFGGLFLLITYMVRFFSKVEPEVETIEEHEIVEKNRLLIFSLSSLALGLSFCFSSLFVPYLCSKSDSICTVQSVGVELLFFVPVGIVLIIAGVVKLYRYFKK